MSREDVVPIVLLLLLAIAFLDFILGIAILDSEKDDEDE